ncbi:MAG TPA: hypothetical protein VMH89_11910 [Candidatus Acidoferrum sp.]|nr:hypothetical protein [Candidatus Acidoferrum sp.]
MWAWLTRWQQRQHDLALGVDADLVRDNRRRYQYAVVLLGCGCVLGVLSARLGLSGTPQKIIVALAIVLFLGGILAGRWAAAESAFLSKPDREDPPKVFRK